MVTIRELSELCGVSMSTVSKALNGNTDISNRTREQVINKANEMGYFPNANARALKLKKTYNIGVLYNYYSDKDLIDDYLEHILSALREEASLSGYDITFIEHHVGTKKMTYLEHCLYRNFDGVCIICADYGCKEVKELADSTIPVVTIDRSCPNSCSIISDNYGGMKQLTDYIIRQGHKKIAFIHGSMSQITQRRLQGFYDTLKENNITVPKEYAVEGKYRDPDITGSLAVDLLKLADRPTCIIAPDDRSALGILNAANQLGLRFINDISVAGYDSVSSQQYHEIRLTSVKQKRDDIGKVAAKILIRMIEHPGEVFKKDMLINQTLIIGNSVIKTEG